MSLPNTRVLCLHITALILLLASQGCHNVASTDHQISNAWSSEKRSQFLQSRMDTAKWDIEMLAGDIPLAGMRGFGPFEIGAFPSPRYDLLGEGSFKGLGNVNNQFDVGGKPVVMSSFTVGANTINEERLLGAKDEVFFQILILTDTIDIASGSLSQSLALSRNHPDYLGQGFCQTKKNRIDYVAFQTAEGNAYAIVNLRIFDLSHGKTILISPQLDQNLRSMQIDSPALSSESVVAYSEDLLSSPDIIQFFTSRQSI